MYIYIKIYICIEIYVYGGPSGIERQNESNQSGVQVCGEEGQMTG